MQQQAEGFLFIATAVEPFERHIGGDIGRITTALQRVTVADECGIVVIALPYEYIPMVEACGLGHKVPLTYYSSFVATLLQQFREGLLRAIETAGVVGEAVCMAMLAGEHACTTGATERICHKAICKFYTIVGYAVYIGRTYISVVVCTYRLIRMVVTHDEKNVHPLLFDLFTATDDGQCSRTYQCIRRYFRYFIL